jgi:hypothetical protein
LDELLREKMNKEALLAHSVIEWLQNQGWEVYQEVCYCYGGPRCDIVATRGPLLWAIEVKTSLTTAVLGQAYDWLQLANLVSVAVPLRHRRNPALAYFYRSTGIGEIGIDDRFSSVVVLESWRPRLQRKIRSDLRDALREEHKSYAVAGNSDCLYYSPFKDTCREVVRYVASNPGCTMKEMIDSIHTHYASVSSAKSALAKWIDMKKIAGVEARRDGRLIKLYPIHNGAKS